ncbi:hypothetical protein [Thiocapsa marina]|uniref:Uncharacterized protein n=1 Tax=Thiocapsa marina 5811 TaxID=768671 RepID=F9UAX7_9GAMM|nr:hypothetical protein [Thiocapsa marina]EGV18595.1 hypothetical protein ThimaDRAFT_2013 [Thiocapsa marina 5811]
METPSHHTPAGPVQRARRMRVAVSPRAVVACGLLGLAVSLAGCAGVGPGLPMGAESEPARDVARVTAPPRWQGLDDTRVFEARPGELLTGEAPPAEPRPAEGVLFNDPGAPPVLFSQDPAILRAEVAAECLSARSMSISTRDGLDALVASLYSSVIDPAEGTEALILGNCAPTPDIVREMVAKGGDQVLDPVSERARALSAPRARRAIETAAADGLTRHLELNGSSSGPTRLARDYAMAYFPSAGPAVRIETSNGVDHLYRRAMPGFGVYTFVMVGPNVEQLAQTDQARHRELFRLVETYAAGGDGAEPAPSPDAHVFLIPVDVELGGMPLFNQVAAGLSDRMRGKLIEDLRGRGDAVLAARLQEGAGPFLVAGLEPDLLPGGPAASRLVADLSGLGIEHLYAVVDAFDREVDPLIGGSPESLAAIRDRLRDVRARQSGTAETLPAEEPIWFFMLGGTDESGAGAATAIGRLMLGVADLLKNEPPSA